MKKKIILLSGILLILILGISITFYFYNRSKKPEVEPVNGENLEDAKVVNSIINDDKRALEIYNTADYALYDVLYTETVTVSHYGHDCYGEACSLGLTASGYYIGDGREYYNDPTFDDVRIVAADKKYPLGTIIRLSYKDTSFKAIVLDRGGGIGDHAKFQIDLLTSSEAQASKLGVIRNVKLEVLRLGY